MPSTPSAVEIGAAAGIELAQAGAVRERVFLPAAKAQHDVAHREFGIARGDDVADRAADHRLPDFGGLGIGLRRAHAAAHVRVERQIADAHQHLAVAGLGHRTLRELEIAKPRPSFGPALEENLPVGLCCHRRLLFRRHNGPRGGAQARAGGSKRVRDEIDCVLPLPNDATSLLTARQATVALGAVRFSQYAADGNPLPGFKCQT